MRRPENSVGCESLLFVVSRIFRLRFGTALGFGGERSEEFFLGKLPVEHVLVRYLFRWRQGFGLVHLSMALQALDEFFPKFFGLQVFAGDLAQGDDRIFVAVAINHGLGAAGQLASAIGRKENEVESVRDLIDAIFNGDACHSVLWFESKSLVVYGTTRGSASTHPPRGFIARFARMLKINNLRAISASLAAICA